MPHISRREFLGTSLKVGGGAAMVAGLTGCGIFEGPAQAKGSPRSGRSPRTGPASALRATSAPQGVQHFVSRPDLTPPQLTIIKSPAYDAQQRSLPRYLFMSPSGKEATGAMIVDTDGDLVWWSSPPRGTPYNFRPQTYDSHPVLTYFQGNFVAGHGEGHYIVLDDTYQPSKVSPVQAGNGLEGDLHEFLITPYNSALLTSYYQPKPDPEVYHCVAQELDIPTGTVRFQWDTLHQIPLAESYSPKPESGVYDFFHINSIDLWPKDVGPYRQDLLVSSRNTWAAYRISRNRPGGRIVWKLSGNPKGTGAHGGSFRMGMDTNFEWQHDVRALPDGSGVSIFDDAEGAPSPEKQARGLVLSLDQRAKTASLRHQFLHTTTPGGLQVPYEGNAQLLPNGGYLVGWGGVPFVSEFGPPGNHVNGTLGLDLQLPPRYQSYRAYLNDWTGHPPTSELALKVLPGASAGQYVAHMSWNGATEIASWQLRAGPSTASSLPQVAAAARTGFETVVAVTVSGSKPDFQAVALDDGGEPLGTSRRAAAS